MARKFKIYAVFRSNSSEPPVAVFLKLKSAAQFVERNKDNSKLVVATYKVDTLNYEWK